jgi:hypothetical protein
MSDYFWKTSSKIHPGNIETGETTSTGRAPKNLLKIEDIALEVKPGTYPPDDSVVVQDIEIS